MKRIGPWEPYKNLYQEKSLSVHFTEEAISLGELVQFEKGEKIYQTGDEINYFYIFLYGGGKVYMIRENGRVLLLEFYKPYQVIGDLEFVDDILGVTEVECVKVSVLVRFPMEALRQIAGMHPPLLRLIISELGRKLYNASISRSGNQLMPLKERMLDYMSEKAQDGIYVWQSSQMEMAEYFGVSERHFRRVLSELEEDGRILRKRGRVVLIHRND